MHLLAKRCSHLSNFDVPSMVFLRSTDIKNGTRVNSTGKLCKSLILSSSREGILNGFCDHLKFHVISRILDLPFIGMRLLIMMVILIFYFILGQIPRCV